MFQRFFLPSQILILAILCSTATAQAQMNSSQIRQTLAGKTLYLSTPLGTELPIRFTRGGAVRGFAGGLAKYLAKKSVKRDSGKWWVSSNKLCKRWKTWFNGKTYCFRLKKSGKSIRWRRSDGKSGTARISG